MCDIFRPWLGVLRSCGVAQCLLLLRWWRSDHTQACANRKLHRYCLARSLVSWRHVHMCDLLRSRWLGVLRSCGTARRMLLLRRRFVRGWIHRTTDDLFAIRFTNDLLAIGFTNNLFAIRYMRVTAIVTMHQRRVYLLAEM